MLGYELLDYPSYMYDAFNTMNEENLKTTVKYSCTCIVVTAQTSHRLNGLYINSSFLIDHGKHFAVKTDPSLWRAPQTGALTLYIRAHVHVHVHLA